MSDSANKQLRIAIAYDGTILIAATEKTLVGHVIAVDSDYYTVHIPRSTVVPVEVVIGKADQD